ncbi:unnamed protein product [Rotaria magnacalcarata]|uniref:Integrase catalytic domain-containing protein n=1 Tax=Rotaria magnacalcarata TaxID=392030 RepID=A0A819ZIW0_9BILA|nr:unnamed protein product [Rotaria magnacalcarata]CAF4174692.1 unnamed protein product [Rotaria magnacalcarata]
MEGGGDSLVNSLSWWLTGNFHDNLKLRQQLVSELIAHPILYGLDLNKASKFELKIMNQEGINLIPEDIKAFSNLYDCQVVVFEKRTHPIYYGEDSLPNLCYLNSYNSFHYNLLIKNEDANSFKIIKLSSPSPIILPEGRVENELSTEIKCSDIKNINKETIENKHINLLTTNKAKVTFNKRTRQEIQVMQKSNDQLKLLKEFVLKFPPGDSRIIKCRQTPDLMLFLKHINNIFVHENILVTEIDIDLETHRLLPIVTLNAFIQGAIDIHLSRSHCGQHVLQTLLRETVWNPHDWRVIKDVCHTCQVCQRFKPPCNVAHPGFQKIISACPFDLLSIDLVNLPVTRDQFKCCLVAIDHFTKYMYTVPLKDKTADTVVQAIEKVVFQRCLQLPSRILSDNGPEFDNTLYRHMLVQHNIKPIYTSPNHPESNGGVERANQTLIKLLALHEGEHRDWVRKLPDVVRTYNSNPHTTTKRSPVSFFLERANSLRNNYDNLLGAAWREPSHKFAPFMLNQLVSKRIIYGGHLTSTKFAPKYEGPFKIVSIKPGDRSYEISMMVNEITPAWGKVIRVHHSHLRPWVPRPNYLAAFDLGGEVFPPAAQLNKIVPNHNNRIHNFGKNILTTPCANLSFSNNFTGLLPATPLVQPIVQGGNTVTPSVTVNIEVPRSNDKGGENTPRPLLPPTTSDRGLNFSTPININFSPEDINSSPIINNSLNLNNSSLTTPEPFEGFPRLDSSLEEAVSRLESLLESPPKVKIVPIVPNIAEMPADINIETTVPQPVVSPSNIENPLNINIETTPPETINLRSRLTRLSPITNPMLSRLRSTNAKPSGFYKS